MTAASKALGSLGLAFVAALSPGAGVSQDEDAASYLRCLPINVNEEAACPRYEATIVQLIARPELFDGLRVMVTGYIHLEFEGRGLYIRQQDFQDGLWHNGLWLGAFRESIRAAECQDRYVILEGVFQAREFGHRDLWSGTISDISLCIPL